MTAVPLLARQAKLSHAPLDAVTALCCALLCVKAWWLQPSLRKLRRSRSLIMSAYYGFLWAITILNLFRCILQMARNGTSATHAGLWNAFWLLTRFGEQVLLAHCALFTASEGAVCVHVTSRQGRAAAVVMDI
jgi:hypothetical protein